MDIIGEYHGLRVGSALLCIVAGCIIIGVSRECDADAVGGIFLGAGGLGLLISIYPFIKAWLNINNILPSFGNFRVHPAAAITDQPSANKAGRRNNTASNTGEKTEKCKNFAIPYVSGVSEKRRRSFFKHNAKESQQLRARFSSPLVP
uniref:Kinocilin n=1 Tax=Fundulus heteroclitus TaxID=8078 RepID=A0A3Q2U3Q3_FUNHE